MPTATETTQGSHPGALELRQPPIATDRCDICRQAIQLAHGLCPSCFNWLAEQIMPIRT